MACPFQSSQVFDWSPGLHLDNVFVSSKINTLLRPISATMILVSPYLSVEHSTRQVKWSFPPQSILALC